MKKEKISHTQLPNEMSLFNLVPRDQYIYVCIRSFMNKDSMEAFPSLTKIASMTDYSIPTIRASISHLVDKGYIEVIKRGKINYYKFNKLVKFEPFSNDFLNMKDLSSKTKSFLIASQQYMYKDVEGEGCISLSIRELADKINYPESSIRKCNNELERKGYLTIVKNNIVDKETGCKTDTKVYWLGKLFQGIIWNIKNLDERTTKNESEIEMLKRRIKDLEAIIFSNNAEASKQHEYIME